MLLSSIEMNNQLFDEAGSTFRLKEDLSGGDQDYDMYAARKNGKPKDDYPSKLIRANAPQISTLESLLRMRTSKTTNFP
jgi:hypothetical protein